MKLFLSILFFVSSLISFAQKEITIEGVVKDDAGKIANADITLEDENGNIIITTKNDPKTGAYNIKLKYNLTKKYFLCFSSNSTFFNAFPLDLSPEAPKELNYKKVVLKRIKANTNYIVGNIDFTITGNDFTGHSYTSLKNLQKVLTRYPKMIIEIEGHVDGNSNDENAIDINVTNEEYNNSQQLSDRRAQAVLNYLVKAGIKKERISTLGYSNNKMLYPNPNTDNEHMLNRRIEIKIILL